jgi:TOBE domain
LNRKLRNREPVASPHPQAAPQAQAFLGSETDVGTFQTQTVWDGSGDGHWEVVLTEGRARVLATIPLNDWISLGATQVAIALHDEERHPPCHRAQSLPARIVAMKPLDQYEALVVVSLGEKGDGAHLLSRMTRKSWAELGLAEGQSVYAQVKYVSLGPGRGEPEE